MEGLLLCCFAVGAPVCLQDPVLPCVPVQMFCNSASSHPEPDSIKCFCIKSEWGFMAIRIKMIWASGNESSHCMASTRQRHLECV